jgi:hypothetical protein
MDSMGGLLTKGLGASACNSLIYGPFRLKCFTSEIIAQGGGGPHVREGSKAAKIIQNKLDQIYRDNRNNQDDNEALEKEIDKLRCQRLVTVTLSFKEHKIEREYIIDTCNADKIVNVINFSNKTKRMMFAYANSFKQKLTNIFKKDQ